MIRSERVRDLISAAGITQAELARRVHVTQGAIAKLAKNNPHRSSVLHLVARELGTTPAYLTGETDDPEAGAPTPPALDADERELIDQFKLMSAVDRKAVMHIARSLASARMFSNTHKGRQGLALHDQAKDYRGE